MIKQKSYSKSYACLGILLIRTFDSCDFFRKARRILKPNYYYKQVQILC